MIWALISGLLGGVGNAFSSFFGYKADGLLLNALENVTNMELESEEATARAQAIVLLSVYGSPAERTWRPLAMYIFLILILFMWAGIVPTHFSMVMGSFICDCFKIGLMAYIPAVSFDKWTHGNQVNMIANSILGKKIDVPNNN